MQGLTSLSTDLAIILGVAGVAMVIFQKLRQPLVLGYLTAGMIVGPYTPPYVLITDINAIHVIAQLGVIFLMFALGLEFSFHKLKRIGPSASITGVVEVVIMLIVGYFLGLAMHWPKAESLFLGAALAISSTTIIIKAIGDLKLKQTYFAELVFGVLVIEDLIAIVLLVVLSTLSFDNLTFGHTVLFETIVRLLVVVGGWFLIGYFLVPILFRKWLKETSNEILIVVAVALCLGLVCLAQYFDYSVALGAFIMGSILAETHECERIESLVHPLRDIFAAVFFVSVGMLINPIEIWNNIGVVLLIAGVTIVGKVIASAVGALMSREHPTTALQIGCSMAQIGEFSFIIAGVGVALNLVGVSFYPLIVAVSVITTFTTPYLIEFAYRGVNIFEQRLAEQGKALQRQRKIKEPRVFSLFLRNYLLRLSLNAIMVAISFKLSFYVLDYLWIHYFSGKWFIFTLILVINYSCIAPFVFGMLWSARLVERSGLSIYWLWLFNFLAFVSVFLELYALLYHHIHTSLHGLGVVLIVCSMTFILRPVLSVVYSFFERHLQHNLNHNKDKAEHKYER